MPTEPWMTAPGTTELTDLATELSDRIPRLLAEHDIPGLAIGVTREQEAGEGWTVCGHSGGGFSFLTDLYCEPAARTGVAVLANFSGHPLHMVLALEVLARLAGRDPRDPFGRPALTRAPATVADYGEICGEYAARGVGLNLEARAGLAGSVVGETFTPVGAAPDGDFVAGLPGWPGPVRMRPVAAADRRPSHLAALLDGSTPGYNSAPLPPSPEAADSGEALDLRTDPPRYASIPLRRRA
jgi:hypothetical protein